MTKYIAEFDGDAKTLLEVMFAAGRSIATPKIRIAGTLQVIAMGFLAPLGLIAIGIYFAEDFVRNYTLIFALLAFLMGWFCILLTQVTYREMARISATSAFGAKQRVEITPDALTLITRNSQWRTSWADVSAVSQTKGALCVTVSALALYVPKAALDDPDKTFADMQNWHNTSIFA